MGSAPVLVAAQKSGQLPASGLLTPSQWYWYLNQVSGVNIDPTSFETYVGQTGAPISLAAYWAAVMLWAQQQAIQSEATAVSTGVAGLHGLAGLGSRSQPGHGQNQFPPPATNGRYDLAEMGWQ